MADLTFYTNPMSRGRIVRWMLEETGADYETVLVDFNGEARSDAFLAVNPMGKVPAIVHRGRVVTECAAICAYLAEAFPDAGLAPPPDDRADYYRWLFFAAGPIEAAVTDKALGVAIPPEREAMVGYGSFARVLDVVEDLVSRRETICDHGFTAADLYLGSHLAWGMMFGSIDRRPAFTAYVDRLQARPAFQRASQLDDTAMPAQAD